MRFPGKLVFILALFASTALCATLPAIKVEKYTLPNGLDVVLHEDHSVPVVAVNVCYHVGSKNEKPGRTGFAHLFEHLMFEGSQHCANYDTMEAIGGNNNAFTAEDRTDYFEVLPSNYLELGLWLESDRLGYLLPTMNLEKLNLQRDVVKNERRQRVENQPYAKSEELLLSLLYPPKHPYSWPIIGSMEDLSSASLEDVENFFKTYYVPNNASLCIAGDFDPANAKTLVEKYFAPIPAGPPIDRMQTWIPEIDGVKRVVAEDKVSLPKLYMVWPAPPQFTDGEAEMLLLSNVLASGKTSRLYKSLVYEKQIAQDVNAYINPCEISGTFNIEVTAKEGHSLQEIEVAVDSILQDILKNGITQPELTAEQNTFEANYIHLLQGAMTFAFTLNNYNTFLKDPNRFQWDLDRYTSATPASVQKYAKKYLDLNHRVILQIVPQPEFAAKEKDIDRSSMPKPAAEPVFTPPTIQKATLSNGLELLLVEKHDLPLVGLNIFIKSGWAADPQDRPGTASLTSEMMNEGTKTRNALQISNEVKQLGASLAAGSSFDGSSIHLDVLKKNLDAGMTLISDIVLNPTFPKEELERQRQIYLGRIQQEAQEPSTAAEKLFQKMLFGKDHPYAQPFTGSGTESSINALTRADLENYYSANYLPNNATAIVVGDLTLAEAKSTLEKYFAAWKSAPVAKHDLPPVAPPLSTKIYIMDKPDAPQSSILVGHLGIRRSDSDYVALSVMNSALGGQFTARLNRNLRETKGFTYGVYSEIMESKGIGSFCCAGEIQTEHTAEAISEMIKELRDISGKHPLTDVELTGSKQYIIKTFPQDFQTQNGIMNQLVPIAKFDLPLDEWSSYLKKTNSLDVNTATLAAKTHLHPDALIIAIVGDKTKIEPELRKLNLGEITIDEEGKE